MRNSKLGALSATIGGAVAVVVALYVLFPLFVETNGIFETLTNALRVKA